MSTKARRASSVGGAQARVGSASRGASGASASKKRARGSSTSPNAKANAKPTSARRLFKANGRKVNPKGDDDADMPDATAPAAAVAASSSDDDDVEVLPGPSPSKKAAIGAGPNSASPTRKANGRPLRGSQAPAKSGAAQVAGFAARLKAGLPIDSSDSDGDEEGDRHVAASSAPSDGEASEEDVLAPAASMRVGQSKGRSSRVSGASMLDSEAIEADEDEADLPGEGEEDREDDDEQQDVEATATQVERGAHSPRPTLDEDDEEDEDESSAGSSDDAEMHSPTPAARTPASSPKKAVAAASASSSAAASPKKVASTSAAASPKQASGAMHVSSPAASPVKAWKPALTFGPTLASNGGGSHATSYAIKVLLCGDLGIAVAGPSRVARKYVLAWDLQRERVLVLVAHADNATKYFSVLVAGNSYRLQLDSVLQAPGKAACLPNLTHTFKLAHGSKITPYTPSDNESDLAELAAAVDVRSQLNFAPFDCLRTWNEGELINLVGVVCHVESLQLKSSTGSKVTLCDERATLKLMFFEGKQVQVGDVLAVVGGKVWLNSRTNAREVSVWASAVVAKNPPLKMPRKAVAAAKSPEVWRELVDASGVPCGEVRKMQELQDEARMLQEEGASVTGTVMLCLNPARPSSNSSFTYQGCIVCRKKVQPLMGDGSTNEHGAQLYGHSGAHASTSYVNHYLFRGRFQEAGESATDYQVQVDDALGRRIFGYSADELQDLDAEKVIDVVQRSTTNMHKYVVKIDKNGEIVALTMV